MNLNLIAPWLTPILVSLVLLGVGALAFRPVFAKATNDIQERLIKAQKEENAALLAKIAQLEEEIDRQKRVQDTLRYVLKPMGIDISIEGDFIRMYEAAGAKAVTTITQVKKKAKTKGNPVPVEDDDDDTEEE